jgi:hypothetical protein
LRAVSRNRMDGRSGSTRYTGAMSVST